MLENEVKLEVFPLSKIKAIQGNRRLVREKVMQIFAAHCVSKVSINELFAHIFFRDFYIEQDEPSKNNKSNRKNDNKNKKLKPQPEPQKLLTREEISEMLSDTTINWRESDIEFGIQLLNECEKQFDFIVSIIKNISENWEFDRINIIDKTIIIIAASEILGFPDIPIKVTMNEAIEMTKKYSTDKSYIFVNAVIEKMKKHFSDENLIHKTERGSK